MPLKSYLDKDGIKGKQRNMKKEQKQSSRVFKGVDHRLDSSPLVIGDYTLNSLVVQEFILDGGAMFGVVPKPLREKATDLR